MYRIVYRDSRGNAQTVSIIAVSESTARALFYEHYNGIIITIDQICPL